MLLVGQKPSQNKQQGVAPLSTHLQAGDDVVDVQVLGFNVMIDVQVVARVWLVIDRIHAGNGIPLSPHRHIPGTEEEITIHCRRSNNDSGHFHSALSH